MSINIKGTIIQDAQKWVYDYFGMPATCPADVISGLEAAAGQDVDIYINSGGGEIFAGSEIYTAIRNYSGKARIHVTGLAASAASVILCAAESDITPTGMVMIHNVSSYASGDYQDMQHEAEVLETASRALRNAYVQKTGRSDEEFKTLMDQEKWFTAQEAVDMGLCDRVAGDGMQLVAAMSPVIPEAVIDKMTAERHKKEMEAAASRFEVLKEVQI